MLASLLLPVLLLFQAPGLSPRPAETPKPTETTAQKDEPPVVTKHSARVGGRTLNYSVMTGFMPIKNAVSGDTEARIFFMAYTLDGTTDPKSRPLMFSFNGGPGSASVWLHMGDNEQSWLDQTDMVFIDPVGTGYSRATKPEFASKFFGVNGDIDSIGEFIRMYLGRNERWVSPLFLVGESYGTTRAAGLSNHLFERGIGLNGIILISTVMNFQSIRFADNNDLPLVLIFPSYSATAWYHKRLPPDMQRKPLRDVLRESEEFAANVYGPSLLRIDRLSAAEKQGLLERFTALTGLNR